MTLFRAQQDFFFGVIGLPNPFITVKCVLLATDAVSSCFGAVTVGGWMAASVAKFAAVKSKVPEAALYKNC